jgi:hypothetical protein
VVECDFHRDDRIGQILVVRLCVQADDYHDHFFQAGQDRAAAVMAAAPLGLLVAGPAMDRVGPIPVVWAILAVLTLTTLAAMLAGREPKASSHPKSKPLRSE